MFRIALLGAVAILLLADPAGAGREAGPTTTEGSGSEVVSESEYFGVVVWTGDDIATPAGQWPRCTLRRPRSSPALAGQLPRDAIVEHGTQWIYINNPDNTRSYLHAQTCTHANGTTDTDYVFIPEATPDDVITTARDQLIDQAPDPEPTLSPHADVNHLVGLPTWVWLDPTPQPITATATLPGLSATATATPTNITFTPGDRTEPITCPINTPAYTPQADHRHGCTHTYQWISDHSPTGRWHITIDLEWDITWTNTLGDSGTTTPITTTYTQPLDVIELQPRIINPHTIDD